MKGRESGMPPRLRWEEFFDADEVVRKLSCPSSRRQVVEFGCGYGTFSQAVARLPGVEEINAFDIDPEMVKTTSDRLRVFGGLTWRVEQLDFMDRRLPMEAESSDWVMVFNLLHIEHPGVLIEEARRLLRPAGVLSIVHWRTDVETPRGPSLDIRPTPEQCCHWCEASGFVMEREMLFTGSPFHWGLMMRKRGLDSA